MEPRALYAPELGRGWRPWGLAAPVLALLFIVLPSLPFELAMERMGLLDARGDPAGFAVLCVYLVLPFSAVGAVVLAWTRFVERRSLASIGLRLSGARSFLVGHLTGILSVTGIVAAIWLLGAYRPGPIAPAFAAPASLLGIAALLPCFALQSSVEEIVFRGWLLSATARRLPVFVAIALTSALFTLLHFSRHQPWVVTIGIFLFSVFACVWALKARNIWGVMGWHAGWNWLLAVGFQLPVTGIDVHLPALLAQIVS